MSSKRDRGVPPPPGSMDANVDTNVGCSRDGSEARQSCRCRQWWRCALLLLGTADGWFESQASGLPKMSARLVA